MERQYAYSVSVSRNYLQENTPHLCCNYQSPNEIQGMRMNTWISSVQRMLHEALNREVIIRN
jgi:hypothetical protein